jgi:hypothetical protein
MPNGHRRQSGTAHSNNQRNIQRERTVQASFVNPVVIEMAQTVIVEAEICNTDLLEAKITELTAKLVGKENKIKKITTEKNKFKNRLQETIDSNDEMIAELVDRNIITVIEDIDEGWGGKYCQTNFQVVKTTCTMGKKGINGDMHPFTTTNQKMVADYVRFLEKTVIMHDVSFNTVKAVGFFEGYATQKGQDLYDHLLMKMKNVLNFLKKEEEEENETKEAWTYEKK